MQRFLFPTFLDQDQNKHQIFHIVLPPIHATIDIWMMVVDLNFRARDKTTNLNRIKFNQRIWKFAEVETYESWLNPVK